MWHYENQSFLESKISTLEKSVYEIHHTETKLAEVVKNVESQLEKHQKAIKSMVNDCKAAQASDTTRPVPSITEESVASIAASITAEQKDLKNKLKLCSSNNPAPIRSVFITPDFTPLEQRRTKHCVSN